MRLIDADAAIKKLQEYVTEMESDIYYGSNLGIPEDCICEAIEEVPTIEAEPVRHGKWTTGNRVPAPIDRFVCSVCNGLVIVSTFRNRCMYNYCPNCGAKMDGGNEDA